MESLYKTIDGPNGDPVDRSPSIFQERISIVLQYFIYHGGVWDAKAKSNLNLSDSYSINFLNSDQDIPPNAGEI